MAELHDLGNEITFVHHGGWTGRGQLPARSSASGLTRGARGRARL
jgi:hypothetical protein